MPGRARALAGVPSQPNTFYAGFDNGGVWRSTDYGANWVPLFDDQSTGSIGAIAVAPSNPDVIYVGTGAGIIRPDLAIGNGMYKSTDAGRTWQHLGLRDSQMIAAISVDPANADRLFVAVLGHPYGPNAERGVFRSTDGGRTFEKVLFKDDYTSANEVLLEPRNPNVLYATLWSQQQSFIEGQGFGNTGMGIFKSTDGGSTWSQLSDGLPPAMLQANIAIAPSDPNVLYAAIAPVQGPIGFYKSTDAGAHWFQAIRAQGAPAGLAQDMRPLARIGGGDLPTVTVDPKDASVVYTASTVMWRTTDSGLTWSAVRGAPGGDDYQRIWINPINTDIILVVADQGAVVSANRGRSWSNWYNQNTAAMYHVTTDNAFPYRVCSGQQDSGSACVQSRSDDGRITFHDWHPVNIQEYGMAAPDPANPDVVFGSQRTNVSRYDRRTAQTTLVGPDTSGTLPGGGAMNRNVRTMPLHFSPVDGVTMYYASNVVWKSVDHGHSWSRISSDLTRATWDVPASAGKYAEHREAGPDGQHHRAQPQPAFARHYLDGFRRRQHPGDAGRRSHVDQRDAEGDQALDAHLQHRGRPFRFAGRVRRRQHACASTRSRLISIARTMAARRGRRSIPALPAMRSPTRFVKTRGSRACCMPAPTRRSGSRSTMAITGNRCGRTCRPSRSAICRSRTTRSATAPI